MKRLAFFLVLVIFLLIGKDTAAQEDTLDYSSADSTVQAADETLDEESAYHENFYSDTASMRSVPDSIVKKLQREKDFLYANDPSFWAKEKDDSDFFRMIFSVLQSPVFKTILYILLAILVIYILYQIVVSNNLFIFSRSSKKKSLKEEENGDYEWQDLDEQIRISLANSDRRLAIRFLYLKTLRELNKKNIIRLHAQSTNHDYIKQVGQRAGAGSFGYLTRVYEYVWYGEFQPNASQFEIINTNFSQFIKSI